mmetsp:Transcript_20719/g.61883  ORF Transcript_20719/g.61883 Transcript_20719/m.61883 type:complete len:239 (+) Transcript_20719:891-1607(+)
MWSLMTTLRSRCCHSAAARIGALIEACAISMTLATCGLDHSRGRAAPVARGSQALPATNMTTPQSRPTPFALVTRHAETSAPGVVSALLASANVRQDIGALTAAGARPMRLTHLCQIRYTASLTTVPLFASTNTSFHGTLLFQRSWMTEWLLLTMHTPQMTALMNASQVTGRCAQRTHTRPIFSTCLPWQCTWPARSARMCTCTASWHISRPHTLICGQEMKGVTTSSFCHRTWVPAT